MLKVTKMRIGIAVVVAGITIALVGFIAKPMIRPRALGGPIAIVSVDPALLHRGFLGINHESLSEEQRRSLGLEQGIVVTNVFAGGPADEAGIAVGDFLIQVDDAPVVSSEWLKEFSAGWKPAQV